MSLNIKGKKWVVAKPFFGPLTDENLKLVEYDVPEELQPGGMTHLSIIYLIYNYLLNIRMLIVSEVLCQAVYLSVDPYLRIEPQKEGEIMMGEQLCE